MSTWYQWVKYLIQILEDNDRAICDGANYGYVKVYTKKGKDSILGSVIVCTRAGEMISEVCLAMKNGVKLSGFNETIHPYPTYGEGLKQAAGAYAQTKLTTNSKILLRKLLNMRK